MSKIVGVTVGTPISPNTIEKALNPVKTVNGNAPDENGDVQLSVGMPEDMAALEESMNELNATMEELFDGVAGISEMLDDINGEVV